MLRGEPQTLYNVYPSWADFSYRWEDLSQILARPFESGHLDPNDPWEKWGFSRQAQPFGLIDGPCGGGIVCEPSGSTRWLPGMVLVKEANCVSPPGIGRIWQDLTFKVTYLEPIERPFDDFAEHRPPARHYVCSFSPENIESDPESQFWVVRTKKGRSEMEGLRELPQWAFHFDLHVSRLDGCPEHLARETASWFCHSDRQYIWYKVNGFDPKAGLCFAIVVYIGLHLARVGGKRMAAMHMLSGIDGKPNICQMWKQH